jgi:curli biogenesis system outer membrane secretion channel CsgG
MRNPRRLWVWGAIAALVLTAFAGEKKHKNKYPSIEVIRFDIKEGVNFPADYLHTLTEELVSQLKETGKFTEVLREGETPEKPDLPTLRLVGTVTEFQPGSQTKRYLVGFGAGKTKIVAHVKFLDKATGEVLFEDDVDGKVWRGAAGGESIGATRGLAKEVAKVGKQQFF